MPSLHRALEETAYYFSRYDWLRKQTRLATPAALLVCRLQYIEELLKGLQSFHAWELLSQVLSPDLRCTVTSLKDAEANAPDALKPPELVQRGVGATMTLASDPTLLESIVNDLCVPLSATRPSVPLSATRPSEDSPSEDGSSEDSWDVAEESNKYIEDPLRDEADPHGADWDRLVDDVGDFAFLLIPADPTQSRHPAVVDPKAQLRTHPYEGLRAASRSLVLRDWCLLRGADGKHVPATWSKEKCADLQRLRFLLPHCRAAMREIGRSAQAATATGE